MRSARIPQANVLFGACTRCLWSLALPLFNLTAQAMSTALPPPSSSTQAPPPPPPRRPTAPAPAGSAAGLPPSSASSRPLSPVRSWSNPRCRAGDKGGRESGVTRPPLAPVHPPRVDVQLLVRPPVQLCEGRPSLHRAPLHLLPARGWRAPTQGLRRPVRARADKQAARRDGGATLCSGAPRRWRHRPRSS